MYHAQLESLINLNPNQHSHQIAQNQFLPHKQSSTAQLEELKNDSSTKNSFYLLRGIDRDKRSHQAEKPQQENP